MDVIVATSARVAAIVLADFLNWKDLAALDCAVCARSLRDQLHSVLCVDGLEFHHPFKHSKGTSWLRKRGCQASFLIIDVKELYNSRSIYIELVKWFRKSGQALKYLQISGDIYKDNFMNFASAVSANCINLERLAINTNQITDDIGAILYGCKKLTHLSIRVDDDPVNGCILDAIGAYGVHLTHLYINGRTDAEIDWSFVPRLSAFHFLAYEESVENLGSMPYLMELTISDIDGNDLALILNKFCPKLIHLACLDAHITVRDLKAVKHQLDRLHMLSLGAWSTHGCGEDVALYLIKNAKNLRTLSCGASVDLNRVSTNGLMFSNIDDSANGPIPNAKSALQTLTVPTLKKTSLIEVLKQCPLLKLLHLESLPYDLSQGEVGRLLANHTVPLQFELMLRDVTMRQLQYLSRTAGIVELHISFRDDCVGPEVETALQDCAGGNSRTLRRLFLLNCGTNISKLPQLLARCPYLEEVCAVNKGRTVGPLKATDSEFKAMRVVCPRLQYLQMDI